MLHRPLEWVGPQYGVEQASSWILFADDLMGFRQSKLLLTNKYPWETAKWDSISRRSRRRMGG